jgi:hypothetical protein
MSKTLFMFSAVLFLASMEECRACVPEITCFDDYDDQIETNNANTVTATNTNDDNNEMGNDVKLLGCARLPIARHERIA